MYRRKRGGAWGLPLPISPSICDICLWSERVRLMWSNVWAFMLICTGILRELRPFCVYVCPWQQHSSPASPCKPTRTEYSSVGSRLLHLIVCWVIYSEPGIEPDVYFHCTALSSSIGTHAPRPLLQFTHVSYREQLSQNILALVE